VRAQPYLAVLALLLSTDARCSPWEFVYIHGWPSLKVSEGTADVRVSKRSITISASDDLVFSGRVRGQRVSGRLGYLEVPHEPGHKLSGTIHRTELPGECRVVLHLTDGLHLLTVARSGDECAL
jgi:hypothetical protein